MTFTPEVWDGVLRRLRVELPPFTCEAWIESMRPQPFDGGLRLLCPTSFHRDRVREHYLGCIAKCVSAETGSPVPIEIATAPEISGEREDPKPKRAQVAAAPGDDRREMAEPHADHAPAHDHLRAEEARGRRAVGLRRERTSSYAESSRGRSPVRVTRAVPREQQTFESFVVGDCNALAREASLAVVRDEGPTLKQLYLCSPPGLGKTHLSKAVLAEAKATGRRAVYASAEAFTNEFLAALRSRKTDSFKEKFRRKCDVLVIDDVHFLQGKESTQLEFFHTVQHVLEVGGRVVLTGNRLPRALGGLERRVRSQLGEGFLAELGPPDAQVRRNILRAKASAGGVRLPEECLEMLVDSVRGNIRDLESVLIQLVTTSSLLKQPIDADLTREALDKKGAEAVHGARLEPAAVIAVVAATFKTTPDVLAGRSRKNGVLVPRQLAMYLCRRFTDASLAEIGRALGRDHPSVRNAIAKIERGVLERAPLRYQVEALARKLDQIAAEPLATLHGER